MNCIHIIHESRRGNNAAEENKRGNNHQRYFVMRPRPQDWRGNLKSCRNRLLHEFFHRRNIAIPFILTSATPASVTPIKGDEATPAALL